MKVKLSEIIDAIEMADQESEYFLDAETGEIIRTNDMIMSSEEKEEATEQLDEHGFYRLPTSFDIQTYELRPEIEEDFRQMKDFWKLSDFKSAKYNYITFHIVMTLIGYLYFQILKNLEEGQAYTRKSLPVVAKNYKGTKPSAVVIYAGQYFGIFIRWRTGIP